MNAFPRNSGAILKALELPFGFSRLFSWRGFLKTGVQGKDQSCRPLSPWSVKEIDCQDLNHTLVNSLQFKS
jgi:hypothetical protein